VEQASKAVGRLNGVDVRPGVIGDARAFTPLQPGRGNGYRSHRTGGSRVLEPESASPPGNLLTLCPFKKSERVLGGLTHVLVEHATQAIVKQRHARPHPPPGDCVCHRRPVGQADDLHAFTAEDLIEAGSELCVAVSD
jgi:hypothetical protein